MKKTLLIFLIAAINICAQIKSSDKFIQEVATIFTVKDGIPNTEFTKIEIENNNVYAVSKESKFIYNGKSWLKLKNNTKITETKKEQNTEILNDSILSQVTINNIQFAGTKNGLYIKSAPESKWEEIFPKDINYSWKLTNVKVLIVDSKNRLWFGSNEGAGYLLDNKWKLFTGKEGLPYKNFTCIEKSNSGDVWFGTERGAIRTDGNKFYYRFSRRWLADDFVNDIKIQNDSIVWFATQKGISNIVLKKMTLEEKANYFVRQVEERHSRDGFIAQNKLKERFNPNSWQYDISDNDGMYTAMYGSSQAFKYAVTKSAEAKKLAKRSFESCKWLVDISHEKGFPARLIIPIDWYEDVNSQYDHAYNIKKQAEDPFWKDIFPRFPKSKDGKYLWKCDTSSDELTGHYFFYAVYFDLVAETEDEKNAVKEVVGAITDHLIRHGFKLVDYDGKPTRWGNFSPEYFDSIWGWDQRGLNSMMMLSFLNVAYHVTGDQKYLDTAKMLKDKYHYHINAMQSKMFFPPEDVVPWDNNLCLMSMYGLLNYETDPELILMYRESLENSWLHVSKQKSAYWNILYYAMANKFNNLVNRGIYKTGKVFPEAEGYAEYTSSRFFMNEFAMDDIFETLQRLPLDLIGYQMDNKHRLDIQFDLTPGQLVNEGWRPVDPIRKENVFEYAKEHDLKVGWSAVDGKALPIDERCHVRLDRDGFVIDSSEGNGYSENEGTIYLLPYYMARFHGVVK